jgi:tellurite resistance protein
MEFFPDIDVSALEAEAIARGLYAVALVDGVHERELALIADFHHNAALGRPAPLEPQELAAHIAGAPHRELFIKAAYLLAWADGSISDAERRKIGEFAKALGVPADTQAKLEAQVKDFLLRPFAQLSNVEAASAVAKKLDI